MADEAQTSVLDSITVEDKIARKMLVWINTFENLPVTIVNFEQLAADTVGMALSTIQGAYKTKEFITGGYQAEYEFKIIYRIKPGTSNAKRLKADELLNAIGEWSINEIPDVGDGIEVLKV